MNPLYEPLERLFERLNFLNFIVHYLSSRLQQLQKTIRGEAEKSGFSISNLFHGTQLTISDLTEWPGDNWRRTYSSGRFYAKGEEFMTIMDAVIWQEAAWVVSQGYEAFETFLYDVTAAFLNENPNEAKTGKFDKDITTACTDISCWKSAVRKGYRREPNHKIVSYLRALGEGLENGETKNNRNINLRIWLEVIDRVRHAVTHSSGIILQPELDRLSPEARLLLPNTYPGQSHARGYELRLDVKTANVALRTFGEYAYAIYKSLSAKKGYEWRTLPGQVEST